MRYLFLGEAVLELHFPFILGHHTSMTQNSSSNDVSACPSVLALDTWMDISMRIDKHLKF